MRRTTAELLELNYYEIFQVGAYASQDEIRRAYYAQALLYHPDKINLNRPENAIYRNAMYLINNAYETLSNKEFRSSRVEYDYALLTPAWRSVYQTYVQRAARADQEAHQNQDRPGFFPASPTEVVIQNAQKLQEKGYSNLSPEIPAEFLCELTYEVMDNPVKLPVTSQICERSMIERALRSKAENPFNRQPLRAADLVPQPALKTRINAFVESLPKRTSLENNR